MSYMFLFYRSYCLSVCFLTYMLKPKMKEYKTSNWSTPSLTGPGALKPTFWITQPDVLHLGTLEETPKCNAKGQVK